MNYVIESKVIHGRGKGKSLGFATANQDLTGIKEFPEIGVYGSKVTIDGKEYIGVTNVGQRPTVDNDQDITIETNVIDFDGDLYDKVIRVELCYYLRGLFKFENTNQLLNQINQDKEKTKQLFAGMEQ